MDEIGKLDRILDEEDGNVVADEIEITLVGVEFDRKAANVAWQVSGARAAGDRGEPREDFPFSCLSRRETTPSSDVGSDWSPRNSHARPIRGHARCALEFARDRNE
jgi:hypothetical protein